LIIRPEAPADINQIRDVTARAFALKPFSAGTEPGIIDALREKGDLTLSLVAEEAGQILGQVSFSPVFIEGVHNNWFGLGPVSVEPHRQGQRIGHQLIEVGLERIKK